MNAMSDPTRGKTSAASTPGSFAPHSRSAGEVALEPFAMAEAPRNGTVVELLFEGDWYPAYWSESADDYSPHGTTGWAQEDDRLLILDPEGWRYPERDRSVDEYADRLAAAVEKKVIAALEIQEHQRRARADQRERRERVRAALRQDYVALGGDGEPASRRAA